MKVGSKFEKGGDKLKPIHVPLETWTKLDTDLITNLPKTEKGSNVRGLYEVEGRTKAGNYLLKEIKGKGMFTTTAIPPN